MKVFVLLDDQDQHGAGCECGDCDANGKSHGAGIFKVGQPDDCLERLYACNETEAIRRAEERAKQIGELVVLKE